MNFRKTWPIIAIAIFLLVSGFGYYLTLDASTGAVSLVPATQTDQMPLVDDRLMVTARQLSALAETAGEAGAGAGVIPTRRP